MKIKILIKSRLFFIFMVSFSWGIGLKGLLIPENGYVLSTVGTGIAEGISPGLNPAFNVTSSSYIQFSLNRWLGDIKGSHIAYHFGKKFSQSVTLQTWNAKELQLWGDTPNSNSLGTFSSNMWAFTGSFGTAITQSSSIGLSFKVIQQNLFSINDFIVINNENTFNYVFLCELNFDQNGPLENCTQVKRLSR